MKKNYFYFYLTGLIILLVFVVFYMLFIHVPYYNYHRDINNKVKTIIEDNNYVYSSYSHEYRGYETFYIIKIEDNGVVKYVAYNEELELVDEYNGNLVSIESVRADIKGKYGFDADSIEIGYENDQFVYYDKHQDDDSLLYVYYSVETGEFIKAVGIGE